MGIGTMLAPPLSRGEVTRAEAELAALDAVDHTPHHAPDLPLLSNGIARRTCRRTIRGRDATTSSATPP
jgi:hypothetical protein